MTSWRDVIVFDNNNPAEFNTRAAQVIDLINPYLPLARLGQMNDSGIGLPINIRWYTPSGFENWSGQSDYSEVRIKSTNFQPDSGWESTLVHELIHVYDKHCLSNYDRQRIMDTVSGCLSRMYDKCVEPLEPRWSDYRYAAECQELLAFVGSQHIWYAEIQGAGRAAEISAYGYYTFDLDVTLPVILDVLAGPTQPKEEDMTTLVKKWIYAEGADLLAAMSVARATSAAVVVNRNEAKSLIGAGATITIIGGPACEALGLTWATTGKVTKGNITTCNGANYADSLSLAMGVK